MCAMSYEVLLHRFHLIYRGYYLTDIRSFLRNASRVDYSIDSQPPYFANDCIYVGYEVIGVVIYLNFGDVRHDRDPVFLD